MIENIETQHIRVQNIGVLLALSKRSEGTRERGEEKGEKGSRGSRESRGEHRAGEAEERREEGRYLPGE